MDFWEVAVNTFLVLFFVFLNGFFVAAEFAIVKVRSTQIEPLALKGDFRAKLVKSIISNLDLYLSASQIAITMSSLALGWVGEPFAASVIAPIFSALGIINPGLLHTISFAVGFAAITLVHIILGEQAPKNFAIRYAKGVALSVAYPLFWFSLIFKPVIAVVNWMAMGIIRLLGIESATAELVHSEEELRLLLSRDQKTSKMSKEIALRAMDFRKKQGRHIMKPRKEIVALCLADPVEENIQIMRANKFSRYPVYETSIDQIKGIVHTKDIFRYDKHLQPNFALESVLRDAPYMPETVTLEKILATMQSKRIHMILLADEYGSTSGLITLEDVLEELVGTIQDEFDREQPEIVQISADEYVVDANVTTNDIERLLDRELSPMDIRSIGALVIDQLGHLPQRGEMVEINFVRFVVEQTDERTIETIRIKKLPLPMPVD
jgi:CBS domain containing-hemolysin-like protein